ncbi:MAG: PEP-CTERM sorting domain-containing protein [Caenispirillum sp.]|nr:PEP-CTERM sorting domain-containing protein [Caenispirillum sp.]
MNMKNLLAAALMAAGILAAPAQAEIRNYSIVTTWYEPDTQPKNSIFTGTFSYDTVSHQVTGLTGTLTESMTGTFPPPSGNTPPYYDMVQLNLAYQMNDWIASYGGAVTAPPSTNWHQNTLAGTFATVFLKNSTNTFSTMMGGNGWSPASGVTNMGLYHGFPGSYGSSIQNAYAMIFVPDAVAALTPGGSLTLNWNEGAGTGSAGLAATAYADCAPGGMMGAVCMTATSAWVYGAVGTMSGYPLSQTITAAVPEPESYAMLIAGLGLLGWMTRRRLTAR